MFRALREEKSHFWAREGVLKVLFRADLRDIARYSEKMSISPESSGVVLGGMSGY